MSGSKSTSRSQQNTFVDPGQQPFLDFLRGQGQGLAEQQLGADSGFQSGVVNPALQAFQQQLQGDPGQLEAQIEQHQFGVTENLRENLLPLIGSSATATGGFGGSRQGVAEGIALRDASRQQSNIATNLTGQAQQRQLQALQFAPQAGQLAFQPLQNLAQLLGGPTVLGQGTGQSQSKSLGF